MRKIGLILAILLFAGLCSAQKVDKTKKSETVTYKPSQLLKQAKIAAKSGDIFTAIDYYKIYDEMIPGKPVVQHELGNLLLREKDYREASVYLLKAFKLDQKKYVVDIYNYAICLQTLGNYEEAKQYFNLFISETKGMDDYKEHAKLAKTQIEGISAVPILLDSALNVIIKLLDTTVNKPHIEFSPIPYEDNKLIYASLKEEQINYYDPEVDKLPTRKFYLAQHNGDKWKFLGEFDTTINGNDINTGNGAFSADKKRFYFSRCERDFSHKIICQLFVSNLENNEWLAPVALPEIVNTPLTSNSMPTVGVSRMNTDVVYFVSDRPEGRGGLDLWFTYYDLKKLEWKEPKNCGKRINSMVDEITPYYNIDTKNLYFSSNGQPGLGGFDIYRTFGDGKSFDGPKNVGFPINSSFDDLYYILGDNRQFGFFTSNRSGGYSLRHENCCDDIYEFIYRDYINIAVTGKIFGITDSTFFKSIEQEYQEEMALSLAVLDISEDIELLYDYPVNLFLVDKNTGKELFVKTDFTGPGHYFFNLEQGNDYVITVKDFNKKEKRLPFTTKNITRSDTLELDAIIVNTLPAQAFIVQNIYYDFAKSDLRPLSQETIDKTIFKILNAYPQIIIEISSHTDSIDTDEKNMKLSQDRAQSVVDYLILKGISPERLVAKGYGENSPIAPNSNPDGTDNPDGRQKNRRTEFKVVGQIENEEEITYEDE
jgi:outer membrane protein OmpA-like peptidoglycan-associated protein